MPGTVPKTPLVIDDSGRTYICTVLALLKSFDVALLSTSHMIPYEGPPTCLEKPSVEFIVMRASLTALLPLA